MTTTKIYRNDSKETLDVLGIGEIPAGEQVSVTGEYQPQVILVNYPGLVDVLAEEASVAEETPAELTSAPVEEPTNG